MRRIDKNTLSNVSDPYTPDGWWSLHELFRYYKHNLGRFTNLIIQRDLDDVFRPGKYSPEASNNIEKILQYADANFEPTLNATSDKLVRIYTFYLVNMEVNL